MDPIVTGSLITAGASYIGGASSARAQSRANSKNMWIYKNQRDVAQENRRTAYQTATEDMRKAGINPMLAYMQGGAGSAPSASANMQAETGEGEGIENAVNSAISAKRLTEDIKNLSAERSVKKATVDNLKAQKLKTKAETQAIKKQMPKNEAIGESGKLLKRGLETISNSARNLPSQTVDNVVNSSIDHSANIKMKRAEREQKIKYYQSKAYKDARKARRK